MIMMSKQLPLCFITASIITLYSLISPSTSANTLCDDQEECQGSSLSNDIVFCNGYHSCAEATLDVTTNAKCFGYKSCHDATITSDDDIACTGSYSCQGSSTSLSTRGTIYCNGDRGCQSADIIRATSLDCGGEYGCAYSDITDVYRIYGYGDNSLIYSDIEVNNRWIYIYLGGSGAGDYGDLVCDEDSVCYVYCVNEDSCANFDIYCYGFLQCRYSCDSDCQDCPNFIDMSANTDEETRMRYEERRLMRKEHKKQMKERLQTEMNDEMEGKRMEGREKREDRLQGLDVIMDFEVFEKEYVRTSGVLMGNNNGKGGRYDVVLDVRGFGVGCVLFGVMSIYYLYRIVMWCCGQCGGSKI